MDILRKLFRKKRSMLSALIAAFTMLLLSSSASAASAPNDAEPIPYATFDDAEGILTLSYGEPQEGSFKLNTDESESLFYGTGCYTSAVKKVVITESFKAFKPKTTDYWFSDFSKLETIEGIGNINTDEVTDMKFMFHDCSILQSLDLSGFNTENVEYMSWMFYGCRSLKSLNLSSFNTENVEEMTWMFSHCENLKTIYVSSKWNTANVSASGGMFSGCTALTGGNGTTYNENNTDITYARIDGGADNPGYLTLYTIYATFDDAEGILTLSYGEPQEGSFKLNTDGNASLLSGTECDASAVKKVVITESFKAFRPATTAYWFSVFLSLETIEGIGNLNTDEVTDMGFMFFNCCSLKSLDLSSFNTAQVTDMRSMFFGCSSLKELDLSSFNTAQVTDMRSMFFGCSRLKELDLSSFSTSAVKDMSVMFYDCSALRTILVGDDWNEGTNSNSMFTGCKNLIGGNGTKYDEDNPVTNGSYAVIDGKDNKHGYLTSVDQCTPYAEIRDDGKTLVFCFGYNPDFSRDEIMALNKVPEDPEATPEAPAWEDYKYGITTVVFDKIFRHARPTTCYYWFANCENLTEIRGIEYLNTSEVTDMSFMFYDCSVLKSLDLTCFKTGKVESMECMFYKCNSLKSLDLRQFETNKVTKMGYMFCECITLKEILGIEGFTTENVTDMGSMFSVCYALKALDLSGFKTDKVTDMSSMFYSCQLLSSLDLSSFKTNMVKNMSCMFDGCANLQLLNISNFNTENVTNMSYMFGECYILETLDLRTFNTAIVTDMFGLFFHNYKLKTILVSEKWDVSSVTKSDDMFLGCPNLIGGNGTTYDEDNVTASYAIPDGYDGNPGYLTNPALDDVTMTLKSGVTYTYTGEPIIPETVAKAGGQTLTPGTDYNVSTATECINAGEHTVAITFHGKGKYAGGKTFETATFTIFPATPTYTIPENLSLKCNQTLADLTLPKGFTIDNPKADLTLGSTNTAKATFTPEDTKNYEVVKGIEIKVAVADHVHADPVKEKKSTPSCEKAGSYEEVVYCSVCGKELSRTSKTSDALGHNYAAPTYSWSDDGKTCTATAVCKNDKSHVVTETATITSQVTTAATTESKGTTTYTATFKNEMFKTQTKAVEDIDKLESNENPNTPVSSITDSPVVKVWSYNRTIYIASTPDSQYKIIDLQGRTIATSTTKSSHEEVNINKEGVYVVIINGKTFKLSL